MVRKRAIAQWQASSATPLSWTCIGLFWDTFAWANHSRMGESRRGKRAVRTGVFAVHSIMDRHKDEFRSVRKRSAAAAGGSDEVGVQVVKG